MTTKNKENPLCPICSSNSRFWEQVQEKNSSKNSLEKRKQFFLYKCDLCGHGFFYPGLIKEELLNFYDKKYAQRYIPEKKSEAFKLRREQYKFDVNLIKIFLTFPSIAVLDYGCSTGQFLNSMPPTWNKFGFEINQFELEYISKLYKEIITFSNITQIKDYSFDLITLRGVIEHLFDFEDLFLIINNNLKNNGLVYICATPDFNSPCSHIYKSRWNQISAPLHYHQFTATSIAILFGKHGFGLKYLYYPYDKTPYADFQNDASKFINNIKRILECKVPINTNHAYPGTMMSLIFKKL